jgi:hypothetical protein
LPPLRPTLATTHPELYRLGERLLWDIMNITKEGDRLDKSSPLLIERLPDILSRIIEFIEAVLSIRALITELPTRLNRLSKLFRESRKRS